MLKMLLILALLAQDDKAAADKAAADKAADAALEKFKTGYKSNLAIDRAGAVAELAQTRHEKVLTKLGQLTVAVVAMVRLAAIQGLAGYTVVKDK
jgi:hypothetical protein